MQRIADLAASLDYRRGLRAERRADWETAADLYRRLLDRAPIDRRRQSDGLFRLGWVYRQLGKDADAEATYWAALRLSEQSPVDTTALQQALHALGNMAGVRGDYAEASSLLERALIVLESARDSRTSTPPHGLSELLYELGTASSRRGRDDDARNFFQRAIAAYEAQGGSTDPRLVSPLNDLAIIERDAGNRDRARQLNGRALELATQSFGEEDRAVVPVLETRAHIDVAEGRLAEGRALLERALRIKERTAGPDSLEVAITLNTLGAVQAQERDFDAAGQRLTAAHRLAELQVGPRSELLAYVMHNQALLARETGQQERATDLYRRASEMLSALNSRSLEAASSFADHADFLRDQHQDAEAAQLEERANAIYASRVTRPGESPPRQ